MAKTKRSLLSLDSTLSNPLRQETLHFGQSNRQPNSERSRNFNRQIYIGKGFLGCVGGLMIHLVIGSLYQWALLNSYITSYFILHGYQQLTTKDMGFVFPLMMFSMGTAMNLGLRLGSRYKFSNVLIAVFTLASLFVFASSFFANIIVFVFLYVMGFGLCMGISFLAPIKVCNEYFPNKQHYVNGFILIGSGLGSVVFGSFAVQYLNPLDQQSINRLYIDQSLSYIAENVPGCIRWLSLLYFVVGVCGSLLLKPLQTFNNFQIDMQNTMISKSLVKKHKNDAGHCLSFRQAIVSQIFWVHVLTIILACCGNILINTSFRSYATQKEYKDSFLNIVGFIGSSANGFSRYFWSIFFNRVGYKNIMAIILSINIICLFTLRFAVQMQGTYLGFVFIFNCTLGGLMVLAPTFSTLIFGKDVGPRVFGIFWCAFGVGNFLQYIYLMIFEPMIYMDGIIIICIVMNILNIFIIITYKYSGPWKNDLKYFKFSILPKFELIKDQNQLLVHSVITNRKKSQIVSSFAYNPSSSNLTYS